MLKRTPELAWLFDLHPYENHKSNLAIHIALFMVLGGYIGYSDRYLGQGFNLDSISAYVAGRAGFAGSVGTVEATGVGILIYTIFNNFLLILKHDVHLL